MSDTEQLKQARLAKKGQYEIRTHLVKGSEPLYTNRLILEDSPYLLQHAHNPVNWYAWGEPAFAAAKVENKPVFLSIGYSTCHWCHVMEEESFDNERVAELLNRYFISIKVDREQRPDLDEIYMTGVQFISGHGGWPMSSFLTSDGKPFYGATYFPPQQFMQLLERIQQLWHTKQSELESNANSIATAIGRQLVHRNQALEVGPPQIEQALAQLIESEDSANGGFGAAPKFPNECQLLLFLDQLERTPEKLEQNPKWDTLYRTLTAMLQGGIYDQLAGGFHRYSTDAQWLTPHFEKMLYNQAQLSRLYVRSWALSGGELSGDPELRRISEETLDYILREMCSEEGAFYSATDADSEGQEGKFFVWPYAELKALLNQDQLVLAEKVYGVTRQGNFEGSNILYLPQPLQRCAKQLGVSLDTLLQKIQDLKQRLYQARQARTPPLLDNKIITEWNGMMISALAEAGYLLKNFTYIAAAKKAALFLWHQRDPEGYLYRIYCNGKADTPATLEDYSQYLQALITLYDTTREPDWLNKALLVQQQMTALFWNSEVGGFYSSQQNVGGPLIVRAQPYFDGATAAGNSVALIALATLNYRHKDPIREQQTDQLINRFSGTLGKIPTASCHMLTGLAQRIEPSPGALQYAADGQIRIEGILEKSSDNHYRLTLSLQMSEGWHIYGAQPGISASQQYPTRIEINDAAQGWKLNDVQYPDSSPYQGKIILTLYLEANPDAMPLMINLHFQPCNDQLCLTPECLRMIFRQ